MPSNNSGSSAIANMISQRAKLSAVRQRMGLETSPAEARARAKPAKEEPFVDTFDYEGHQLDPAKLEKMHQMASDHLYSLESNPPEMAPADNAPSPSAPAATTKPSPSVDAAMAPIASFFKENGRMPNSEELSTHMMKSQAKQQLGREPTAEELSLYVAKPAR